MKLRILTWRDYPGPSVALDVIKKGAYEGEAGGDDTHRRRCRERPRLALKTGGMWPQASEGGAPEAVGGEEELLTRGPGGRGPDTLISDWSPELGKNKFLLF